MRKLALASRTAIACFALAAVIAGCASFDASGADSSRGATARPARAIAPAPVEAVAEPPVATESIAVDSVDLELEVRYEDMALPDGLAGPLVAEVPAPKSAPGRLSRRARAPETSGAAAESVSDPAEPESPSGTPAASPLFNSTVFDDNATVNGGFLFIPPDNHAAAGPNHVLTVVNCGVRAHNKVTGASVAFESLESFFSGVAPLNATFDPRVIFDEFSKRFIVVTLELTDIASGDPANTSRIFVAVSDDDNPIGTWFVTQRNAFENISGAQHWVDYPEIAVDEEAIYITGNMFRFFNQPSPGAYGGTRLWTVAKAPFYSGGAAVIQRLNPYIVGGSVATTTAPAMVFPPTPAGVGTFLVSYSGLSDGTSRFLQWIRINTPLTAPAFTGGFVTLGTVAAIDQNLAFPPAPQLGSGTGIATNDRRALSAFYRKSDVWMTMMMRPGTASPANSSQVTAAWARLDFTALGAPTLQEFGYLGGEAVATGTFTTFPAVAVNHGNFALFGYSTLDDTIFPSAHFSLKDPGSPAGSASPPQLLRAGTDFYVRTFGGPDNRWGDYSSVSVDPKDGCFWIFNQWAMARGTPVGGDGRWATTAGRVCPWIFGDDFEFTNPPFYRWSSVSP